jgi:hypothetical protein
MENPHGQPRIATAHVQLMTTNCRLWPEWLTPGPVQWIAAGPCQQSHSWFQALLGPMTIFLFFATFFLVLKWGLLFDRRWGVTTTGHPPILGVIRTRLLVSTSHHQLSTRQTYLPHWLTFPIGLCYAAPVWTTQKTRLPTVPLLLHVDSVLLTCVYCYVA